MLALAELERGDTGEYACVASSRAGKASWLATLRVDSPTNPNINFFRAPEPSSFPGPPGRPHVVNSTSTTVTLSWTRNNRIGASSLLGYQVSSSSASSAIHDAKFDVG